MIYENLQKYSYVTMFVNIAFIIINIAGIFPITYTIAGYPAIEELSNTVTTITAEFESAGNSLEYLLVVGFLLIQGVKILLLFLIMVFFGLAAIFSILGVPLAIYGPIVVVIDCIIMYDVAKILLKLG